MTAIEHSGELIRELRAEPDAFTRRGRSNELLNTYFEGAPVETLRALLEDKDLRVRRAAIFVASELGAAARPLLDVVVPLMQDADRSVRFQATESVAVCAIGSRADEYLGIVLKLEDGDDALRTLAMFLMSNAAIEQLAAARRALHRRESTLEPHARLLGLLVDGLESNPGAVMEMIRSEEPLARRYGAIAAARLHNARPDLIQGAALIQDDDVQRFVGSWHRSRRIGAEVTEG